MSKIEILLKYESNDESLLTELTDQWVNSNRGKKDGIEVPCLTYSSVNFFGLAIGNVIVIWTNKLGR